MSTTTPTEFTGEPSLDADKVATITEWYRVALGDSDKADDPVDGAFYDGQRAAWEDALRLLHNMIDEPRPDGLSLRASPG